MRNYMIQHEGLSVTEPDELSMPKTVLEEADQLTSRDRQSTYGHPSRNFDLIAKMWSLILGTKVTPRQHALCMVAVKLAREIHFPKRDNLVDIVGYIRTIEMLEEKADSDANR